MLAVQTPFCSSQQAMLSAIAGDGGASAAVQWIRQMLPEVLDTTCVHVIPVSGGADSTALAILMVTAFPEVPFRFLFTDTGAEPKTVYESLDRLELFIGRRIERLAAEKSLYDAVIQFNGFLPSARERWCTRLLKLQPYKAWLKQFGSQRLKMYVGIRAEEDDRVAFVTDGIDTVMPFVTLGMVRESIFGILSKTIGIPEMYKHRTRSGCSTCPYMRQSEVTMLLQHDPAAFAIGQQLEKLGDADVARYDVLPEPYCQTSGLARNWLGFPQPDWYQPEVGLAAMRSRAKSVPADLFGSAMQGIWVAVEFWVHDSYLEPVVWRQELVATSTTRHGLQKQIDMHMQHRLSTAEVWHLSREEMQNEARFVLYYLNVDAEVLQVERPGAGSYTWQQGHAYARTKHLVQWAQAALWSVVAGAEPVVAGRHGSVKIEVLGQEVYQPKPPTIEDTYDERYIACPMCSL
ncbi:phosphoadenosine phosphosulfate reductase domain-containing protein [Vogesella indigofera]|uniref:Phosphoadenosine phosphosulfate reductase family protein n=1 Tax=Vogesella indigofera TaxID=45465 RepID=A0ABT5I8L1_VOGIN|nr:phosphoadenosine phosphosulfate reductase family protein [Vogesella indigofera]MDC7692524.1 phosphoadenosine phosphosulfate reductase family protein [Vogesella indigofera]